MYIRIKFEGSIDDLIEDLLRSKNQDNQNLVLKLLEVGVENQQGMKFVKEQDILPLLKEAKP